MQGKAAWLHYMRFPLRVTTKQVHIKQSPFACKAATALTSPVASHIAAFGIGDSQHLDGGHDLVVSKPPSRGLQKDKAM